MLEPCPTLPLNRLHRAQLRRKAESEVALPPCLLQITRNLLVLQRIVTGILIPGSHWQHRAATQLQQRQQARTHGCRGPAVARGPRCRAQADLGGARSGAHSGPGGGRADSSAAAQLPRRDPRLAPALGLECR